MLPAKLAAAVFQTMCRRHRSARQPLEAICVTACSTMACGSGMITSSTPTRISPPAMPNTPDSRAVKIIRSDRQAASGAVMAADSARRLTTHQIYDKWHSRYDDMAMKWNCAISATSSPSPTKGHITRAAEKLHIAPAAAVAADQGAGGRDRGAAVRAPSARRGADRCRPLVPGRRGGDPGRGRPRRRSAPGARRAARPAASPWASPRRRRSIRWWRAPSASSAPRRPDVSFVLEESSSGDLLAGLREERLDIAFIRSGLADPRGAHRPSRCCRRTWRLPCRRATAWRGGRI